MNSEHPLRVGGPWASRRHKGLDRKDYSNASVTVTMMNWLRRVVPDLFLAAVVALLVTLALHHLDDAESRRINSDMEIAAEEGLTLDERIAVVDGSIRRSTLVHLPFLVAVSGAAVGLGCRNRRWAWLTAIGAILPAVIMGVAFFIDRPLPASGVAAVYSTLAVATASAGTALRQKLLPVRIRDE